MTCRTALLVAAPPDLTRLEKRPGERLSADELVGVIDGRRAFRAHPVSEMPVWGSDLLREIPDWEQRERARLRIIQSLAEYLVSIQRRE